MSRYFGRTGYAVAARATPHNSPETGHTGPYSTSVELNFLIHLIHFYRTGTEVFFGTQRARPAPNTSTCIMVRLGLEHGSAPRVYSAKTRTALTVAVALLSGFCVAKPPVQQGDVDPHPPRIPIRGMVVFDGSWGDGRSGVGGPCTRARR